MTESNTVMDYATPVTPRAGLRRNMGLILAIAVAAGFLGANRFADAVGFPPVMDANRDSGAVLLRVICGIIVGVFTLMLAMFLAREAGALVGSMQRSGGRFSTGISITLLICGTVCVVASLFVPLYLGRAAGAVGMHVAATGAVMNVSEGTPLLSDLLAVLTFLIGAALAGIGIWGSLRVSGGPVQLAAQTPHAA